MRRLVVYKLAKLCYNSITIKCANGIMTTEKIILPRLTCKRCEHEWVPRTEDPVRCPKCLSPYWNRDRRVKGDKSK